MLDNIIRLLKYSIFFILAILLGIYICYNIIKGSIDREGVFISKDFICAASIEEDME